MPDDLNNIYRAFQDRLEASLAADRIAFNHPVARGDTGEMNWSELFEQYLPYRYQVNTGFVVDCEGNTSHQIDIIIYDRQYTPVIYNRTGNIIVPAESVYAIFEVKQNINRDNIIYAAEKAYSVRCLRRTSFSIVHAGGEHEPRSPIPIMAGILAYSSEWSPPFGGPLQSSLQELNEEQRIDLGCAISSGFFEATYEGPGNILLNVKENDLSLVVFFFTLLKKLQSVGTVTAIDYSRPLHNHRP